MEKTRFLILLIFACSTMISQNNFMTEKNIRISEIVGDLDKDGINEKVEVWNTNIKNEDGLKRELQIFKKNKSEWVLWKKYNNCLLASEHGGMMGDPFGSIEIKNGILMISHEGGSSWKWNYSDKYKFQNGEFKLIGYTGNYGKLCEYWMNFDFNVSSGKIIFKKEFETCDENGEETQKTTKIQNETFYFKNLNLTLKNRFSKEIKIVTPKYKIDYYL